MSRGPVFPVAGQFAWRRFAVIAAITLALAGCDARHRGSPVTFPDGSGDAVAAPLPALIPAPVELQRAPGRFDVAGNSTISVASGDTEALHSAQYLAGLLQRSRGLELAVRSEATASRGSIRLQLDPAAPVAQAEGYALDVDSTGMRISARDGAGLFHGAVSAWQLLTTDGGRGAVSVGGVHLRDWPRFGWRGQHLDVARHFMEVETVKHVIDAMALHKLNVLHLHLTDDQGWRIEIKRYPRLTDIGAWRTPPGAGTHGVPERVGGFYTQEQIRDLVAYAAARHITILPEIDMPGHARAAVAAYPQQIGVDGVRTTVGVNWGIDPYLFNTSAQSMGFIEQVLDEVLALFPSPFIHIGGDEAIKDQWQASAKVRAQMRKLGVKDAHAMQGWFNAQLATYLTAHGRRLIGWDEILEGGLPANASVMSWRGIDGAVAAAQKGHDVVLAPAGWMYLNYPQSTRGDEPAGPYDALPLSRVYELDPVPASLSAEQAHHVLGVQGALWTEYMTSPWHVDHALFPRLAAVAEVGWSPMQARDWNGFLERLPAQLRRYQALGIGYGDGAFAADISLEDGPNPVLAGQPARIQLGNQTGFGQIHYTTDGSEPGLASPRYLQPFAITLPATVKAKVFSADGSVLAATRSRRFDQQTLRTLDGQGLRKCPEGGLGLRALLLPDMTAPDAPTYNIDVFHMCWTWPQARLDGIAGIRIEAARLARNYGLAHDQSKVLQYPSRSPRGELDILQGCDGERLASVPLPAGDTLGERFVLEAPLPARTGVHDLCLRFTSSIQGPIYAIGKLQLLQAAPGATPSTTP